jgi:site-specific DNA-cytosine methylase
VLTAIEFFSGIGAFAAGAAACGVRVVAAFDQSPLANRVYRHNFGLAPRQRNLDGVRARDVPDADVWWMSPPCQPFTVRGRRRDDQDPRAASFVQLIGQIGECSPPAVLVENVSGFVGSRVHAMLLAVLAARGYDVRELDLCPTLLGVPMRRPRRFVAASRAGFAPGAAAPPLVPPPAVLAAGPAPLASFLDPEPDPSLEVSARVVARYGRAFNVVDPRRPGQVAICVTSGYWRCRLASGSLVRLPGGGVRRMSPEEILRLLDFPRDFAFPDDVDRPARWRLAGNSVDVRAVRLLLGLLPAAAAARGE